MRRIGVAVWVLLVIALVGLPAGVQAEGADDGLVAEWRFDEESGSVLADSSGNGNDGVIHGATWVEGEYGTALSFDGVDDYVVIPTDSGINPIDGSWTVEAWITVPTIPPSDHNYPIMAKHDGDMDNGYALLVSYDGNVHYMVDHYKGPVYKAIGTISTNSWYHVTGVLDKSTNNLNMFVNGFQTGSTSISGLGTINPSNPLWIGRYHRGSRSRYEYFNGIIDEIRIYNRALTAEEIKAEYEQGTTALTLTKSAAPHSIKQGQTTTVTITVKNTGTTEITDIEVADTIPSDLTFISGETSKTYTSLRPKDSREFQYVLQPSDVGTFNLDPATATYEDKDGNYHTAESETATITVIPSTGTTPAPIRPINRAATALSITKSPSPHSIRQFGETTITISIENTGTTDATDIEITDAIHPSFDLVSGDFPNPKRYDLIRPGETRDIQYTISAKESGTFTLDPATVTYADEDGNIHEASSEPVSIKVIPSTEGSTSGGTHRSNPSVSTASVQLHGEKTSVVLGEDILLKLSAVNLITKPTMHVQVIIIPPSGMSVTSSAFAKSGAGQYTTTYELEPGTGKDIEVAIRSNQVGDFDVNGRIIYYFGDDRDDAEDHTLTLPITVRAEAEAGFTPTPTATEDGMKTPGFDFMYALCMVLFIWYYRRGEIL